MLVWPTGARVNVQLVDSSGIALPVANVILDIHLYLTGVRRYSFTGGETDSGGYCSIKLDDVTEQWIENRKLFLMDYNTPLQDCDDEVGISAPSADDLAERVLAVQKWFPNDLPKFRSTVSSSGNDEVKSFEQKVKILPSANENTIRYVCDIVGNDGS